MTDHAARQEAGIRFLERQAWNPARAKAALEAYQARPSEELRRELIRVVDTLLMAYRQSISRRVAGLLAQKLQPDHAWIRELTHLNESAGVLMAEYKRSPLDGQGRLCYPREAAAAAGHLKRKRPA